MIDPKELRIGNFCWDVNTKELLRVYGLSDQIPVGLYAIDRAERILANDCQQGYIPLTREWLERMGFEFSGFLKVNDYESETQFTLRQNEENYTCSVVTSDYGGFIECHWRFRVDGDILYMRTRLEFVHQLQNLFYLLTGEELTIKELQP